MTLVRKIKIIDSDANDRDAECARIEAMVAHFIKKYSRTLPQGDQVWLKYVKMYAAQGRGNPDLLYGILHAVHWLTVTENKNIYFRIKSILDFFLALVFLVALSPVLIGIALAIRLDSPGSIFFKQMRIGAYGVPFRIFKFRTMHHKAEEARPTAIGPIRKVRNDPRTTRIGVFLRKHKLDELPQLFNVLKGEMAMVGPRPLPLEETVIIREQYYLRFAVRPGITGLWQIKAPNTNCIDIKLSLDQEYALNCGFFYDLMIMLKTLPVVVRGENLEPHLEPVLNPDRPEGLKPWR